MRRGRASGALNRIDAVCDEAHHRRRVARPGSHLEHAVTRPYFSRLHHFSDDVRLRDGLPLSNREWPVIIGEFSHFRADEPLAGNNVHRSEHGRVANATSGDL